MKLRKSLYAITAIALSAVVLTGCGKNKEDEPKTFSFTAALQSGKTTLETGDTDQVVVYTNGVDDANRTYTYSSNITEKIILYKLISM